MQNMHGPVHPLSTLAFAVTEVHDHTVAAGFGVLGRHRDQPPIAFFKRQCFEQPLGDLTGSHLFAVLSRVILFASMIIFGLACIGRFLFHRRVGGKELPLPVTVLDTWFTLMPVDQKSLAVRTPVDDVVPPELLFRQKPVLFSVGDLSFRRYFNNDLSPRLGCSKCNSLDDLPPGLISQCEITIFLSIHDVPPTTPAPTKSAEFSECFCLLRNTSA